MIPAARQHGHVGDRFGVHAHDLERRMPACCTQRRSRATATVRSASQDGTHMPWVSCHWRPRPYAVRFPSSATARAPTPHSRVHSAASTASERRPQGAARLSARRPRCTRSPGRVAPVRGYAPASWRRRSPRSSAALICCCSRLSIPHSPYAVPCQPSRDAPTRPANQNTPWSINVAPTPSRTRSCSAPLSSVPGPATSSVSSSGPIAISSDDSVTVAPAGAFDEPLHERPRHHEHRARPEAHRRLFVILHRVDRRAAAPADDAPPRASSGTERAPHGRSRRRCRVAPARS